MDGHTHEDLSDEALAREIEAALGVDPSPEFLPRVRARIATERARQSWMWSWRWAEAVAVLAGVGVIAVWTLRQPVPAPRDSRITNASPVETVGRSPGLVEPSGQTSNPGSAPAIRTVRSTRRAVESRPEVMVSSSEAAALRKLVVAIAARQVGAVDIPKLEGEWAPLPPLEEIVLEPIELSPIAGLEGE